jgi:hypothetical protein
LPHVVKPLTVDDVRLRRSSRSCFGRRLHSGTLPEFLNKLTKKVSKGGC